MASAHDEDLQAWTGPAAAVLTALPDHQHALTPLHAQLQWQRVGERLHALLPSPPRVQMKELGGQGFWVSAESPDPLVEAVQSLGQGAPVGETDLGVRFGAHLVAEPARPSDAELSLAHQLAASAPLGGLCMSAALVDRLQRPWSLNLQDRGAQVEGQDPGVHVLQLLPGVPLRRPAPPALASVVAVLPPQLGLRGGKPQAVAEMAADALIVMLSRSAQLRVISRRSSHPLQHSHKALEEAFEQLNAAYVVTGRGGLGMGDSVFVDFSLHARGTSEAIWRERVSFNLIDLLRGDAPALMQASRDIHAVLLNANLEACRSQPWRQIEHYQLLSAAMQWMHKLVPATFERAREALEWLGTEESQSAEPLAWLAQWQLVGYVQGKLSLPEACERIDHLLGQALQRDPRHPFALALRGHVMALSGGDLAAAQQLLRAALDADPNQPFAWAYLALNLVYSGELAEALEAAQLALALSPLDPWRYFLDSVLAHVLLARGHAEAALGYALHAAQLRASHAPTVIYLVMAHASLGQQAQAEQQLAKLLQMWPGYSVSRFRQRYAGRATAHADLFAAALARAGLPPT